MVEFRIQHVGLKGFENFSFALDLVKLTKSAKNRSFPNLSPCCKAPLKEKKFCGTCMEPVETKDVTLKGFKMGKELYPVSAEHLDKIKESLESDIIQIVEFRARAEIPEMYFTDEIYGAKQHRKYTKEYVEYAQILSATGKVAIGTFSIRGRPYPVMIMPFQNTLVMRALHYYDEVDPLPAVDVGVAYNQVKVQLLTKVMELNKKDTQFDITQFVNQREEQENELIEKIIKGEPLPVAEAKVEIVTKADEEEIRRLQELLAVKI